jgi:hypothetical protein
LTKIIRKMVINLNLVKRWNFFIFYITVRIILHNLLDYKTTRFWNIIIIYYYYFLRIFNILLFLKFYSFVRLVKISGALMRGYWYGEEEQICYFPEQQHILGSILVMDGYGMCTFLFVEALGILWGGIFRARLTNYIISQ